MEPGRMDYWRMPHHDLVEVVLSLNREAKMRERQRAEVWKRQGEVKRLEERVKKLERMYDEKVAEIEELEDELDYTLAAMEQDRIDEEGSNRQPNPEEFRKTMRQWRIELQKWRVEIEKAAGEPREPNPSPDSKSDLYKYESPVAKRLREADYGGHP